jgi:ribosomal protein L14
MCIHILGSNRRYAYLGDILIGVVKVSGFKFLKLSVIPKLTLFN